MAVPSDAHLLAFGRIMHNYATVEIGIKFTLGAILATDLGLALITFQPYGALDLKNVAKSVAKERLKPELAERFCWIVGEWAKHNPLRNSIAHNRWTTGRRPDAIKPRYLSIQEGRAVTFGDEPDEADYTPRKLEDAAQSLHETNERLKSFLQETGLDRIMEQKMAEAKAAKSSSSGSEGSTSSK